MIYLTVDGMVSGTGVRDTNEGEYLSLDQIGISESLKSEISLWRSRYESAHYYQYENKCEVSQLDSDGMNICRKLKQELPDSKVEYFSSAEGMRVKV